jgi:hypothetical protein
MTTIQLPSGSIARLSTIALHRRRDNGRAYSRPTEWLAQARNFVVWGPSRAEAIDNLMQILAPPTSNVATPVFARCESRDVGVVVAMGGPSPTAEAVADSLLAAQHYDFAESESGLRLSISAAIACLLEAGKRAMLEDSRDEIASLLVPIIIALVERFGGAVVADKAVEVGEVVEMAHGEPPPRAPRERRTAPKRGAT